MAALAIAQPSVRWSSALAEARRVDEVKQIRDKARSESRAAIPKLSDFGISLSQSSRWQRLPPLMRPSTPRPDLDANVLVGVFEERHQPHAIA
jgi:hypothetical protein